VVVGAVVAVVVGVATGVDVVVVVVVAVSMVDDGTGGETVDVVVATASATVASAVATFVDGPEGEDDSDVDEQAAPTIAASSSKSPQRLLTPHAPSRLVPQQRGSVGWVRRTRPPIERGRACAW
jgi:hypothetical protein